MSLALFPALRDLLGFEPKRIADGRDKLFGMRIASMPVMTDENYFTLLVWTICVLMFACGVVALTEHPEWFGT